MVIIMQKTGRLQILQNHTGYPGKTNAMQHNKRWLIFYVTDISAMGNFFNLVLFGYFLESKFGVILHSKRKLIFPFTDAVARKPVIVYGK